eukprot:TRINITY_DN62542_c0_g1_i1.p1 TRINITY_DN62542_c0_g1~~TRINITY_DN62542_c0_g1_i1.p1  ORF type:complete len:284 (-),score=82.21 TRINITY_DN62542_c0_g1_i1:84-935(-)
MLRVQWLLASAALSLMVEAQMPISEIPADLACEKGAHAAAWQSAKKRFQSLLEAEDLFGLIPADKIKAAVDAAVSEVRTAGGFDKSAGDECGYGRLAIQLLSLALVDDPVAAAQPLQQSLTIANPVLTLLLDIPWVATALSGWPFFGILAQVGHHKVQSLTGMLNNEAVDQLDKKGSQAFFTEMTAAKQKSDLVGMAEASIIVLQSNTDVGVLGSLTALATQAAMQADVQKRMGQCQALQQALRNAIGDARELDIALTTRWPLWSLLHISVDAFASAPPAPAA